MNASYSLVGRGLAVSPDEMPYNVVIVFAVHIALVFR
jgi:hypothetical protein